MVIIHRRLRAILQQAGLTVPEEAPDGDRWLTLLGRLSEQLEATELHLLTLQRDLDSRTQERDQAFRDLAAEHFKLEAVLGTLPQAVALLDPEGGFLLCSPSFENLLGWSESQLATRSLFELVGPEVPSTLEGLQGRAITAPSCGLTKADGERTRLDLSLVPAYSRGVYLGALLTLQSPSKVKPELPAALSARVPEELFGVRAALVVRDEPIRMQLDGSLRALGVSVIAIEPESLTRRLLQGTLFGVKIDLVLLDAERDDLLEAIRSEPAVAGTPVLAVMVENHGLEDARWTMPCHLPCTPQELAETLEEALAPAPFTTVLPAVGVPATTVEPPEFRVLIVEDEPINRMMVEECVKTLGYSYASTESAEEAWQLYSQQPFNLVISDWIMPGLSGLQLCERIREQPGQCYTYFVVLSGKKECDEVAAAVALCGADDYLVKPINPAEVKWRLQVAARFARQEERLRGRSPRRELVSSPNGQERHA